MSELPASPPSQPTQPPGGKPGRPTGKRKWLFRLGAMTLVPIVLFVVLELVLRAGGYGHTTRFFVDGAEHNLPGVWIENRDFGRWAFPRKLDQIPCPIPLALDKTKRTQTCRVFILGESAAQGFPEPAFNFGRILEVMLRSRYPDHRFEIVNTAMTAINSHIVLPIARECADHEPDLFIVHLGNNEVVGPFGVAGVLGSYSPSRSAIQANLGLRRTRTGELLDSAVNGLKGEAAQSHTWGGMSMFTENQVRFDDARLVQTYANFRDNLRDLCTAGSRAGLPVIVCTIPVNLKDSAPFGSLHAAGIPDGPLAEWEKLYAEGKRFENDKQFVPALARYREAEQIDEQYADLQFREARCLLALGQLAEARAKFARAKEYDTIRFRSTDAINQAIREVVSERSTQGVHLADAERTFASSSPMNLPGEELFLEHVHMNFAGNFVLAQTVFQTLLPILDARISGQVNDAMLSQEQCAARLAYTAWNELKIVARMRGNLAHLPPHSHQLDRDERDSRWKEKARELRAQLTPEAIDRIKRIHETAVEAAGHDWMLRMNYGQLLAEQGELERAEDQYQAVLRQLPHYPTIYCKLGSLMLRMGQASRAERHFRDALKIDPGDSEARLGIAEVLGARGQTEEALAIFEEQLKHTADRAGLLYSMGLFLFRAGRLDEARQRLRESLEIDGENPIALASLGTIALRQGNRDEAIKQFEAALQIRPDFVDVQNRLTELKQKK